MQPWNPGAHESSARRMPCTWHLVVRVPRSVEDAGHEKSDFLTARIIARINASWRLAQVRCEEMAGGNTLGLDQPTFHGVKNRFKSIVSAELLVDGVEVVPQCGQRDSQFLCNLTRVLCLSKKRQDSIFLIR